MHPLQFPLVSSATIYQPTQPATSDYTEVDFANLNFTSTCTLLNVSLRHGLPTQNTLLKPVHCS